MSLLRWTSKSTAKLAGDLVRQGFEVSADTVGRILKRLGYSLQSPAKVKEGTAASRPRRPVPLSARPGPEPSSPRASR